MNYLKLIRPINILLILFTMLLVKYALLDFLNVKVALNTWQYGLLIFATCLIGAAGNVVNDIFDETTDRINKPEKMIVWRLISERSAYRFYVVLNVIGVGAGFYLANSIGSPSFAAIFILVSALLYLYATQFKQYLLVGNILVSLLVAMALIVIIIFDIFPAIDADQMDLQVVASQTILGYAFFAFYFNLIREIVKDVQDIDGDKNAGRSSLPMVIGRVRTGKVIFTLGLLGLVSLLWFTYQHLYSYKLTVLYVIAALGIPLVVFCVKSWDAATKSEFGVLSNLLKIILLTGIGSLYFYAQTLI